MPAGLTGEPPGLLRDTAARFGTTDRAIGQRVQRVEAAGRRLPLDPGLEYEVTRPSLPGENHLVRKRSARLLGGTSPVDRDLSGCLPSRQSLASPRRRARHDVS